MTCERCPWEHTARCIKCKKENENKVINIKNVCPKCNTLNGRHFNYCYNCGYAFIYSIKEDKLCPKCNGLVKYNTKFNSYVCLTCGWKENE